MLVATGEFPRAEALLDQVAAAAAGRGDERLAAHARVGRLRMEVGVASDLDAAALQEETRRAIATFAEFEDQRGLAKAWGLLAALGFLRCRIAEAEAAAGQAMTHARLARDDPSESWARGLLAQSAFWGPVPAAEGIRRCQELLEQAAGNRRSELTALQSMAGLQAMAGQPEAARATAGGPWPWPATWARTGSPPWPGSSPPAPWPWPATRPRPSSSSARGSGSWSARASRACAPT